MSKKYCILIHYHEISLKGKNRSWFERKHLRNIKRQLNGLPLKNIKLIAARFFCFGIDESQWAEYSCLLKKIMGINNKNKSSRCNHEATTSKLDEEQLFYVRSRGIGQENATNLIVSGFCKEVFQNLPMEFAVEANKLLEVSMEGSVG